MSCTNCQAPLQTGARFCTSCGTSVVAPAQAIPYQPQIPAAANILVVVAALVLSRPFIRALNAGRFLIGAFGVLSVVRAFLHFEHVRGTPAIGHAVFDLIAGIIFCFFCIAIASALGFIPRLARGLNLPS